MQRLRQDLLPEQRDCLSSSPTSPRYVRRSRSDECRGVNKSSIARAKQVAWNTVDRRLEKAATACCRFNHQTIKKITIRELQVDEIRTLVGGNGHPPVWIFAAIEVWSRLWPSAVVGKRSCRNTCFPRCSCARKNGTDSMDRHRRIRVLSASGSTPFRGDQPARPSLQATKERSSGKR